MFLHAALASNLIQVLEWTSLYFLFCVVVVIGVVTDLLPLLWVVVGCDASKKVRVLEGE